MTLKVSTQEALDMAQNYIQNYLSANQSKIPENVMTMFLEMLRNNFITFGEQQISVNAFGDAIIMSVYPRAVKLIFKTKFQKKAEELLSSYSFITFETKAPQSNGCTGFFATLLNKLQTVNINVEINLDAIPEVKKKMDYLSIGLQTIEINRESITITTSNN